MLNQLITSKTRLRLLIKFFISQGNRGYLNGLATEFNESTNAIRKELNHLSAAGYLDKTKEGNKVSYKANTQHPLFGVLQKGIYMHLGLEHIVERTLERMGPVEKILLIGDYAKGLDTGTIEIVVIGQSLNTDYIEALEHKIEDFIGRKVRFYFSNKNIPRKDSIELYKSIS